EFDATATAQTMCSTSAVVYDSFKTRKCQVQIQSFAYDGTAGDYLLKVLNGDDEELVSLDVPDTDDNASSLFQTFDCPDPDDADADKREMRACIESTTDGGVLKLNEFFLGQGRNEVHFGE